MVLILNIITNRWYPFKKKKRGGYVVSLEPPGILLYLIIIVCFYLPEMTSVLTTLPAVERNTQDEKNLLLLTYVILYLILSTIMNEHMYNVSIY